MVSMVFDNVDVNTDVILSKTGNGVQVDWVNEVTNEYQSICVWLE